MPTSPKTLRATADLALKARFTEAFTRFRKALASESAGWDDLYEALGDILSADPPLYLAAGYKTARAFLAKHLPDTSEREVRRSIRVARYFGPDDEATHGAARLDLLLDYLEAVGRLPAERVAIRAAREKVRVRRGKVTRTVPFPDAVTNELREAARAAAGDSGRTSPKLGPEAKTLRHALSAASLSSVAVTVRQDRLTLSNIPLGKLKPLAAALAKVRLPDT